MTHEEYLEILDKLAIGVTENDEAMEMLKSIRDYGRDQYRREDVYDTDGTSWRDRYDGMKRKYIERFFGDPETVMQTREQLTEERREEETGEETRTYEDLFEEVKSDAD